MQKTYALSDFAEFLRKATDHGFDFVVIGGCAVGAYAQMQGETVLSADLDIYTTGRTLNDMIAWAPSPFYLPRAPGRSSGARPIQDWKP